jgi:hypothetical protein
MSTKLDKFIQKELDNLKHFEVIELPADGNTLGYIDTAIDECKSVFTKLSKKDGELRNLIKNIKNNKLGKNKTNQQILHLANKIKTHILNQGSITNPAIRTLINNRINQLLKTVIYSVFDY